MALVVPGVNILAPRANCTLCYEPYNNTNRLPKMICLNGHTICLGCLDMLFWLAGKCPMCQTALPVHEHDARKYPSNLALLEVLEAFDKNEKRFTMGQATCSDCGSTGGESMFYVCIPCSAKKGLFCDVEGHDFDWEQLDRITTCANCVLKKHKGNDHRRIKLLALRVRRDRRDMDLFVTGIEKEMGEIIAACGHANIMAKDAVAHLRTMVDMTHNVNSSIVLHETKEFIKQANMNLVEKSIHMRKACLHYNREIMEQLTLDKKKKHELATYCVVEEEEEVNEAEDEPVVQQEDIVAIDDNTTQAVLSEAVLSMVNQDVALSQIGLAMTITTLAMVFLPIVQSPLVWDSLDAFFTFLFRLFGSIFTYFFHKNEP